LARAILLIKEPTDMTDEAALVAVGEPDVLWLSAQ
jgi:hypothetical protein